LPLLASSEVTRKEGFVYPEEEKQANRKRCGHGARPAVGTDKDSTGGMSTVKYNEGLTVLAARPEYKDESAEGQS